MSARKCSYRRFRHGAAPIIAASFVVSVADQQSPTFHTETRLVVLDVTVTKGRGELVTNLDRGAFSVYEDGRLQPITLFRRDDVPISLGLVIDNSGSMRSLRASVEAAALELIRASNPLDDVFVLNFADKPRIDVPITNDMRALEAGIGRADSIGGTAMRDAILMAEDYLREHASHDRRRRLLVITDGIDNASHVSAEQLRKAVQQTGEAIFAVTLSREDRSKVPKGGEELEHLTELTGGGMYNSVSLSEVEKVVREIAHQLRGQYTIGYTPTNQMLDGSYRRVRVKITKPSGLTARTRPGYWATPVPSASFAGPDHSALSPAHDVQVSVEPPIHFLR